jgi:hypothetical protein
MFDFFGLFGFFLTHKVWFGIDLCQKGGFYFGVKGAGEGDGVLEGFFRISGDYPLLRCGFGDIGLKLMKDSRFA